MLGDSALKSKYDADRRKAGLYPANTKTSAPPRGNPFSATSAWPPPPRRAPNASSPWRSTTTGATPNTQSGADRFSSFPKPAQAPTSKKDAAQDRANVFSAWQHMNPAQKAQAQAQAHAHAQSNAQRPRPPPRADTTYPSEEEVRAGTNYRKPPPAWPTDEERSAWAKFNSSTPQKPGMARSNTTKTPRKAGFDPQAPGSDERQASQTFNYSTRHRTSDTPAPTAFPPPPPRQQATRPTPFAHFKADPAEGDAPYSEGTRVRTPYSSYIGERTDVSGEQMRRSQSTRDATNMHAQSTVNANEHSRYRSASPPKQTAERTGGPHRPFVVYSSSEDSEHDSDSSVTSPESDTVNGKSPKKKQQHDPPNPFLFNRKKVNPTPPSKRFSGPPPPTDSTLSEGNSSSNNANDGKDGKTQGSGMGEKSKSTMYGQASNVSYSQSSPNLNLWSNVFPFGNEVPPSRSQPKVPAWAVPSSVMLRKSSSSGQRSSASQQAQPDHQKTAGSDAAQPVPNPSLQCAGEVFTFSQFGLDCTCNEQAQQSQGFVNNLSNDLYFFGCHHMNTLNSDARFRFTFPLNTATFDTNFAAKSRSEENINATFSQEEWSGKFTGNGAGDFFAVPLPTGRKPSPVKRGSSRDTARPLHSQTSRVFAHDTAAQMAFSATPIDGSAKTAPVPPPSVGEAGFSADIWKDSAFDFGPAGSRPASRSETGSRRPSRTSAKIPSTAAKPATVQSVDESEEVFGKPASTTGATVAGDAMDIDPTPPSVFSPIYANNKEPRLYAVPPSHWRQSHAAPTPTSSEWQSSSGSGRQASGSLQANLDDLAQTLNGDVDGLNGLGDIRSTLPFTSKASSTSPVKSFKPRTLPLPPMPRSPETPQKLTRASWAVYCKAMAAYLSAFHVFNKTLLEHFQGRLVEEDILVQAGIRALEASGQGGGAGILSYGQAVKEDERVRECWNIGHEKHYEAIKVFEGVKQRVRKLSEGPGLVDV